MAENEIIENNGISGQIKANEEVVEKMKSELFKAGVNFETIAIKLREGMDAYKVTIDKFGDEHKTPDFDMRHKYIITASDLLIKNEASSQSTGMPNINLIQIKLSLEDRLRAIVTN